MTTASLPQNPQPSGLGALLKNPQSAISLMIAYIAVMTLGLVFINQRTVTAEMYSLLNIVFFTAFTLSPIMIISLPTTNLIRGALLVAFMFGVVPVIGLVNSAYLEIAIQICLFAGMALGLNIVVGFAGLLDLGYVAFFAVGAYLWGMFTSSANTVFNQSGALAAPELFYLFLVLGVIVAALVGILLGSPVIRLKGDYLAIVTLGFGELIRILARNLDQPINFTNGSQGLHSVGRPPLPDFLQDLTNGVANFFSISLANPTPVARQLLFYFLAIGVIAIIIVVARRLEDSPIGRAWTAIREDEVAARAMGVSLVRMKLMAFATGASFGGAIGVLYAAKQTFIDPSSFGLLQSIGILVMVIVGGMGNIKGVLLGAMIITLVNQHVLNNLSQFINRVIPNLPSELDPTKYQPLIFGSLLVAMMLFRPAGLLPAARRRLEMEAEAEDEEPSDLEPDQQTKVK